MSNKCTDIASLQHTFEQHLKAVHTDDLVTMDAQLKSVVMLIIPVTEALFPQLVALNECHGVNLSQLRYPRWQVKQREEEEAEAAMAGAAIVL